MNKKFLGIRIGTLFSLLSCLLAAFLIWIYVGVISSDTEPASNDADKETEETAYFNTYTYGEVC